MINIPIFNVLLSALADMLWIIIHNQTKAIWESFICEWYQITV
ncbi:MAG: hypothetical protein NT145_05900 [Elusimicrobia bacterium]|nr:hypothetical protein [Elusimicrobiota bacterium]